LTHRAKLGLLMNYETIANRTLANKLLNNYDDRRVRNVDDKIRGDVEHTIDEILDKSLAFDPDIRWVFDFRNDESAPFIDFKPISSKPDFLLGFVLGRIYTQAWQILIDNRTGTDEDFQELEEIIKRRLPEIKSKITFGLNI